MKLKSYVLVSVQLLSVLALVSMIAPGVLPTPQEVYAGEPARDSRIVLTCIGLIPATPSCVGEMQPFESIVYDADNDAIYDAGELVLVGGVPSSGAALT